jgi:hypothetical protein
MFAPVSDKLKQTFNSTDSKISEEEKKLEVFTYQSHLQTKREKIYSDLLNELNLKLGKKQRTQSRSQNPNRCWGFFMEFTQAPPFFSFF